MTEVAKKADITTHDGKAVTVVGRYAVIQLGRHRLTSRLADGTELTGHRVAQLEFGDGGYVDLGVRPDDELDSLDGQRVSARGTLVAHPPRQPKHVAQPDSVPTLMDVEDVTPS